MSDIFFEADSHDPSHRRYWKPLIVDLGGAFYARIGGELMPVVGPRFRPPRSAREAAQIASYVFGGKPLPRPKP